MKTVDLIIVGILGIGGVLTAIAGFIIKDEFYMYIGCCGTIGGLLHANAMSQLRRIHDGNEKD